MEEESESFSYFSLLRELLLCMMGFDGDVFVTTSRMEILNKSEPGTSSRIMLASDIDWIDEPDREILNRLAELGSSYQHISSFIEDEKLQNQSLKGSMYRKAVASGLSELLDVYRASVLNVEQMLYCKPPPVLSIISYYFNEFQVLLPVCTKLVMAIKTATQERKFSVQWLLQLLHNQARSGIPVVQSCMSRIQYHCINVMLKQLTAWMVHGVLLDPYDEFFITASGTRFSGIEHAPSSSASEAAMYAEWQEGFACDTSRLPSMISPDFADHIIFVGKAVRLLRSPGMDLLPPSDTLDFARALGALSNSPSFNVDKFESVVVALRTKVSALLWNVMVGRAGLMSHLATLKNYFLLARGDFFQNFLEEARSLMSLPPRPSTASADIATIFQGAASHSSANDDPGFGRVLLHWVPNDKFKVSLSNNTVIDVPAFEPGWDNLIIDYQLEWPLGLLLTPELLARYNAIFQLLLRLKRAQLLLEEAWRELGQMGGTRGGFRAAASQEPSSQAALLVRLCQLRHHLSHLLTNLQIYIQVDVIEVNYVKMVSCVGEAKDFLAAQRAHLNFVTALMQQTFLTSNMVRGQVATLFKQVSALHQIVVAARRGDGPTPEGVSTLENNCAAMTDVLLHHVQSQRLLESHKVPYLRQFYMRLNYNNYMERFLQRRAIAG